MGRIFYYPLEPCIANSYAILYIWHVYKNIIYIYHVCKNIIYIYNSGSPFLKNHDQYNYHTYFTDGEAEAQQGLCYLEVAGLELNAASLGPPPAIS